MADLKTRPLVIVAGAKKVASKNDITPGCRLFYQLGRYTGRRNNEWCDWRYSDMFKEINEVADFVKSDDRLTDPEYINHHNFHIVLPQDETQSE